MAKRQPEPDPDNLGEVQPHSLDAERAVLGACLVNPAALEKAAPVVRRGRSFYRHAHRRIFDAMLTLAEERRSEVDLVTVREELTRRGHLDDVGGIAYLARLTDGVPRSTNVEHYAKIVHDHAIRREIMAVAAAMASMARTGESTDDIINAADKSIVDLQRTRTEDRLGRLADGFADLYADLEWRVDNSGKLTGTATGYETLDAMTSGWQRGDLVLVGARPSIGKTAFALNSIRTPLEAGRRVLFFSLEMRRRQLEYRLLSTLAQVPLTPILGGWCSHDELARVGEALSKLQQWPLWIDDRAWQTVHDIRATARQVRAEAGSLDLIVVDYVQLITGSLNRKGATRNDELTDISRRLKLLADELAVPIVALAQLKRGEGRRPSLTDFKDCGAFEQDADVACLLHRKNHKASGITDLLLEKQRNGPTGKIRLMFQRDTQTMSDAGEDVAGEDVAPEEQPKARRPRGPRPYADVAG